jgi:hypothetical protein
MRFAALALLALLCFFAADARACSPSVQYMNLSVKEKTKGAPLVFIGKVEETGEGFVVFRIGTPGQGAAARGETMKLDHKGMGTCGELQFKVGEVWLYAGDSPLGPSQKINDDEMDAEIDAVIARLDAKKE